MQDKALNPLFQWRPFPQGDPPPEIYDILRDILDRDQLLQFVNVLLESEIRIGEARLEGAKQLHQVVQRGLKG